MQEEVTQKTIALSMKTGKLTALSQSCLLPRPGRRTVYSSDPRTQPKPVESHGLDVTAQVPVVQPT